MRTHILVTSVLVFTICSSILSACAQTTDPVKKADNANEKKSDTNLIDEKAADFLVKSADARMMSAREGKLATEKGTSAEIREYGAWMVKDQAILLEEIKKLAAQLNITLPANTSEEKQKAFKELEEKSGKDFDEKFIKMITLDHERDVKLFKKAMDFDNKQVSAFAKKYLPTIQSHLDRINEIHKSESKK